MLRGNVLEYLIKRQNIISFFSNIIDSYYYVEILSSKSSEIKEVERVNYKLMYDNNPKYKRNKGIEFLKIEKSKVLIGLLILRFKTNRECMGIMARKIKSQILWVNQI